MREVRKRREQIELPRTAEVNSTLPETMGRSDKGMEEWRPGGLGIKDPKWHPESCLVEGGHLSHYRGDGWVQKRF